MKKLLYYTSRDMSSPEVGINKKIKEQIATFRRFGFQVDAIYRKNVCQLFLQNGITEIMLKDNMRPPYKISASKWLRKYIADKEYDGVYIRYVFSDGQFIQLLKCLFKKKVSIILEMPSYPYDAELCDTLENKIVLLLDKIYRNKLHFYVDRIVTFSKDKEIFSVPTIQTINGINFNKIQMISNKKSNKNKINIIAVADLASWHGYDRLLEGMGIYYHNVHDREIVFHLVGDGPLLNEYKVIVQKWGIESHVIFYGRKYGSELDEIYEKCDIAAECFGCHRKGVNLTSSLKSREYSAKGLPVIASNNIDIFLPPHNRYFLKFPENDLPLEIEKIIAFYDKIFIHKTKIEVAEEIRDTAKAICDINTVLKPAADYFAGKE